MKKRVPSILAALSVAIIVTASSAVATAALDGNESQCTAETEYCELSRAQVTKLNAELKPIDCEAFGEHSRADIACAAKQFAEANNMTPRGTEVECVWFDKKGKVIGFTLNKS